MANVVEKHMLVLTDAVNNNNKFWEITLHDDMSCLCRWGRVGADGQSKTFAGLGEHGMNAKIREKEGKGYKRLTILGAPSNPNRPSVNNDDLRKVATQELTQGKSPELVDLIDRLAKANRHQLLIASGGQMDLDLSTGIISTPVGVVTQSNIDDARKILAKVEGYVKKKDFDNTVFMKSLNEYLMLVPQKVGHARGWHHYLIPDMQAMTRQSSLLDQLESSVQVAQQQMAAKAGTPDNTPKPPTFAVTLELLQDKKIIKEIEKFYMDNVNRGHASSHLRPVRYYVIDIESMRTAYENDGAKMTNIMRLWHGTRVHNLLSIFKGGLIIPKSHGSIQITGRMFGDGLYFSDQATKSLNYSYGYWDGGAKDDHCFMFLADVAMGKTYTPTRTWGNLPHAGHDSTFAKAGVSGVANNEMIVYRTGQANLRYLIEFGPK